MNKKAVHFGKAVFVILSLILIFIAVFFFVGREEVVEEPEPIIPELEPLLPEPEPLPEPELQVSTEYCSLIDDNFNCENEGNNVYQKGEDVFVLVTIDNLESIPSADEFIVRYSEIREIYDPSNKLIGEVSGKIIEKTKIVPRKALYQIKVINHLTTSSSDDSGNYKVSIQITDDNVGISKTKDSEFRLI